MSIVNSSGFAWCSCLDVLDLTTDDGKELADALLCIVRRGPGL